MSRLRRFAAVLLALCLTLGLAACGDTRWICEVDGNKVPAGLYIYYQTEGYGDALYQLAQEDSETYLYPYIYYYNLGYVDKTLFSAALSSGETVEEHINSYAIDMCKQYTVVDKLFNELGLEITDDEQSLLDSQVRSGWQNSGEAFEKIGIGEDSYEMALLAKLKENKVFDAYYEVGGRNGTTEEEVMDFFAENYARVKYMTFTFADSVDDAIDEGRKNEQLELANEYLADAQGGADFDELIERHNAELEIQNADETDAADDVTETEEDVPENTDETGETEDDGALNAEIVDPYANESVLSKDATYPTEKFVNYVFTTVKTGDCAVVQDDTCFYVVQRLDITERDDLYDSYRSGIMQDLFDDEYTKLINTELAKYTVNVNDSAIKRYKPEKAFPEAEEE